ncbi:response regulator [Sulfurospirillum sp. 'SP']|nr:diguanylate cyclase [Sulfurospirillum sp. 'SP']WNY99975.1 response regulator [Sulfurospirillum sp. 'SP']
MKKILVVEDSSTVLTMLKKEFAKHENIEVFYAQSYEDATKIVNKNPDIKTALLDINLPDAPNGEIVALANLHTIPTVVLTGTLDKNIRNIIQKKDIAGYIIKDKPSSITIAVKNIMSILNNYDTTVMIVEDSLTYRNILKTMLAKTNVRIIEAKDGQEALEIFKTTKEKISLVITDYEMPVMDGLDLTIKLREIYGKDELSIIAISSSEDKSVIDDFLTFGANDFIVKPFSLSEVRLRTVLNIESIHLFEKISNMANRDFLTGSYNRRYFFESANAKFAKANRNSSALALATIDIDKFKNINDTYGHDVGDIAIKEIKKVLDRNLREYDLVARFGGEEFCILLEDITCKDLKNLFERIRVDFEKNIIKIDTLEFKYTVSTGIAYGIFDSLEEMLKISDEELYKSKENGRNQVNIKTQDRRI